VFNVGPMELVIIFILALLVVGPKKLPEVSRQLGKGIREFRRVSDEVRGEIDGALSEIDGALSIDDDDDDKPKGKPSTVTANGSGPDAAEETDPTPEAPPADGAPADRTD
jgi:sec-independent protein translocase protein TatB